MLIDYVTELLKDGKWHYIRTIARKLDQPEERIRVVVDFCTEFHITSLDRTGRRVKIDPVFTKILDYSTKIP